MSQLKKVNASKIQYWLYAILNKSFGKQVSFNRDSLRHRYDLHKNFFSVSGLNPKFVMLQLELELKEAGYVVDESSRVSDVTLVKSLEHNGKVKKAYVSLRNINPTEGLNVSITTYDF